MYKLINGKPVSVDNFKTGALKNGVTVTGYNKQSKEILQAEGWKELVIEYVDEAVEPVYIEQDNKIIERRFIENVEENVEEN